MAGKGVELEKRKSGKKGTKKKKKKEEKKTGVNKKKIYGGDGHAGYVRAPPGEVRNSTMGLPQSQSFLCQLVFEPMLLSTNTEVDSHALDWRPKALSFISSNHYSI